MAVVINIWHKEIHREISPDMDNELSVDISSAFRQRIYDIPLIVIISAKGNPCQIIINFNRKNQSDDPREMYHSSVESLTLSELVIMDNLKNRVVHPLQYECVFGTRVNPGWGSGAFSFWHDAYSDREYEIQLSGQIIYYDGSKKDFVIRESYRYKKSFLTGVRWLLLFGR